MRKTEDYLIDAADQCVKLAKAGREMAAQLEAMSNTLMARAGRTRHCQSAQY